MPSSGKTEGEDGLHLLVVLDGLCRGVVTASTSSGKLSCGAIGDQDIGVVNFDEGTWNLPRFGPSV